VRQHDGLSYDVGSALTGGQFDANASWEISAIFAPQNLSKVRSAIADEMARALKDGFGADEVQRAKDAIDEQVRLSRAQDRGLAGLLALLVERDQTPLYLSQIQGIRDSLTVDEVNAAFRKYVHAQDLVLGVAGDLAKSGAGH
jgi:zinc protease